MSQEDEIFDREAALEQMGGDEELLVELVEVFLEDLPERLREIREAVARADADGLQRAAHTLKGSVGNFAARAVYETALELENVGKSGDLQSAGEVCARLNAQIDLLKAALADLR